ncbi:MAG: ABC transporter permease [Gemmatimonadetes bacterium]|nr:ABC transporter permease [Gemmatimonadota bacterium]
MFGRSSFRLLLLLYPSWFRDRFGVEMLAEFDASRARYRARRATSTFWYRIILDFFKTIPRAWWHSLMVRAETQKSPTERKRQVLDDLRKDVQLALRGMLRRPGAALIAIATLGLGIGLTAGMFSIVNGVILKGLPVEDPHELMAINRINPSQGPGRLVMRIHDYTDLVERQTTFEGLAAYELTTFNLGSGDGPPDFVNAANVTVNTFRLLRTVPFLGRGFVDEDDVIGAQPVAVIGYRFWQDRFNGATDVLGSTVRLDGRPTEIVGIMPDGFGFPFNQQVWRPLPPSDLSLERGTGPSILALGRLSDGVSEAQAQNDLSRIMGQLGVEYPNTNAGMTVIIGPYVQELIGYQIPQLLYTMLVAVSLVLLIACANVANLLLARASLRSKEVALKTALGATRSRVISQLLTDSTVISVLGAVLGLGIAQLAISAFNQSLTAIPQGVPFWFSIELDTAVLLFVLLLTVGASLLSGVIPAIRASRTDVNEILKDDSRGTSSLSIGRLSKGLVIVEVAFSFALLVSAGLMVKSVTNLANVEFPFDGDNVFTATLSLPPTDYPGDEERLQLFDRLRERLNNEPTVISTSITTELPAAGFGNGRFELEGRTYLGDSDYPSARIGAIDPAYFETLSTDVVEGRAFQRADDRGSMPVAVVNEKFAAEYFRGESALGRRLRLRRVAQAGVEIQERMDWYTIVGVAPDFYLEGDVFVLAAEAIYVPLAQRPASVVNLMVHTRGEPLQITARAREIVAELDPDLPISQVNTLTETIRAGTVFFSIFGVMFTVFGAAALFLASIGLYGVLAFSVNQRRHELGLRVALGASRLRVVRLILSQTGFQLAMGMAIGLGLSMLLGRGLSFVLFGVEPADGRVLLAVAALLSLTSLVACLVPVRRATRVDPMVAMRAE